jgi:hypothetical protein
VDHSSTLGFSPRLRVSVYGTVTKPAPLRGFSWQHASELFAGSENPFGIGAQLTSLLSLAFAYHLASESTTRQFLRFCVPPQGQTLLPWYRNFDLFSIAYAFRPRLRDRLTRSG